jgi:hypothetical protein
VDNNSNDDSYENDDYENDGNNEEEEDILWHRTYDTDHHNHTQIQRNAVQLEPVLLRLLRSRHQVADVVPLPAGYQLVEPVRIHQTNTTTTGNLTNSNNNTNNETTTVQGATAVRRP